MSGKKQRERLARRAGVVFDTLEPRQMFDGYIRQSIAEAFGIKTTIHDSIAPPAGEFVGFGYAAVGLGDLNGDGFGDFAVSAPGLLANGNSTAAAGAVFVYSGKDASLIRTLSDGASGFGFSLASVGDWNGDGKEDLAVGSPRFDGNADATVDRFGRVTVYSGADGAVLREFNGAGANDEFGFVVYGGADFDGDGKRELVVGAPGSGANDEGQVIAYSGADGVVAWTLTGDEAGSRFGHALAVADIAVGGIADSVADVLVGAPERGGGFGSVSLFDGATRVKRWTFDATANAPFGAGTRLGTAVGVVAFGAKAELLAGSEKNVVFRLVTSGDQPTGVTTSVLGGAGEQFGRELSPLGDVDMDGLADVFVTDLAGDRFNSSIVPSAPTLAGFGSGARGGWQRAFPIGDADGDGKSDYLVTGIGGARAMVVTNAALVMPLDAELATPGLSFAGFSQYGLVVADGVLMRQEQFPGLLAGDQLVGATDGGLLIVKVIGAPGPRLVLVKDGVRRTLESAIDVVVGGVDPTVKDFAFVRANAGGSLLFNEPGKAWLFRDGVLTYLWEGSVRDINDAGVVLGRDQIGFVVRSADGTITRVQAPEGVSGFTADRLNSLGEVGVGIFRVWNGELSFGPLYIWSNGEYRQVLTGVARPPVRFPLTYSVSYSVQSFEPGERIVVLVTVTREVPNTGLVTDQSWWGQTDHGFVRLSELAFGSDRAGTGGFLARTTNGRVLLSTGLLTPLSDAQVLTPADGSPVSTEASSDGDATLFVNALGDAVLVYPFEGGRRWVKVTQVGDASQFKDVKLYRRGSEWAYFVGTSEGTRAGRIHEHEPIHADFSTWSGAGALLFDPVSSTVSLVQRSADGDVAISYPEVMPDGRDVWRIANFRTDHIEPQSKAWVPAAGSPTAFGSAWGAMHVAYLDETGDVRVLWWAPGMTLWTIDNLSEDAGGAPKLSGNLVSHTTAWGGLGVTGTDESGNLVSLWWAPGLAHWQVDRLISGTPPKLDAGSLAAWTTSWGGMNVVGLNAETGTLTAYWWAPGRDGWTAEEVVASDGPANLVLRPELAGASAGGRQVIGATTADGHLINFVFGADTGFAWHYVDLTGT